MTELLLYNMATWQVVVLCFVLVFGYVFAILGVLRLSQEFMYWYRERRDMKAST